MSNSIGASYFVAVYENGKKIPVISITDPAYQMLGNLSQGHLSTSSGVKKELEKIHEVISGRLESYSFGGDDWCILKVGNENTSITSGFDEFDPIEIETEQLVKLMNEWLKFLQSYEQGSIPGIKP